LQPLGGYHYGLGVVELPMAGMTLSKKTQVCATGGEDSVVHGSLPERGLWAGEGETRLRPLRTHGSRPPLICLFPGTPGARDLAEHLPVDQPVYEFYEPSMDGLSVYPTIEQLAVTFLRHLRKVQPHGPYQLCGYSTFGLAAYEMARLLDAQGEKVSLLALIDICHPRFFQELSSREWIRYRILRVSYRTKKYVQSLLQGKVDDFVTRFGQFILRRAKSIGWRVTRPLFRTARRPVPKIMQVLESVAAHKAYNPQSYSKRLVLFRPLDAIEKYLSDQTTGWHVCAEGALDIHFVRGDHGGMVRNPNASALAEKLTPYLMGASKLTT
jgi:thioesterase domain-containing protein